MRGLTNEERAALAIGAACSGEMVSRLISRGLVRVLNRDYDYRTNHLKIGAAITATGLLALRLDAAARTLTGAPK